MRRFPQAAVALVTIMYLTTLTAPSGGWGGPRHRTAVLVVHAWARASMIDTRPRCRTLSSTLGWTTPQYILHHRQPLEATRRMTCWWFSSLPSSSSYLSSSISNDNSNESKDYKGSNNNNSRRDGKKNIRRRRRPDQQQKQQQQQQPLHVQQKQAARQTNRGSTATSSSNNDKTNQNASRKQYKVVDNIEQHHLDRLAEAFDELARKEGFDSTLALFADDATFEDDNDGDDDDEDDFVDEEDEDSNEDDAGDGDNDSADDAVVGNGTRPRSSQFVLSDSETDGDDMDARIAAARRDQALGQVSVPQELDQFAAELSAADMAKLGFRPEPEPFGDDETPWKDQFRLVSNALTCPACGADFQFTDEHVPGYIPPAKYEIQVKLNKIDEMRALQDRADTNADWSADDEADWLIRTAGGTRFEMAQAPEINAPIMDVDAMAQEMGLDLIQLSEKKTICKRCHGLQNFGQVDAVLRPGWSKEPLLSQQTFRDLLRPIRDKKAVIIALVDLFDFAGSVLPELDSIAGDNPVIIAANKADLLPPQMGQVRAENWVRRELEYLKVRCLANIGGAVRLVSCKTGAGIGALMEKARGLAEEMDCDIYVVGAANAGKSTLLNRILSRTSNRNSSEETPRKIRPGNANARKGAITTSPLPGTTLRFIKVDLGDGRYLYDTPGLLVAGALTQLLTPEELKIVVPKKQVEPVTFRLSSGKCVLVGGLARVELFGDCKPFFLTFFVANDIKLHQTDSSRADEVTRTHVGDMLTPPLAPERLDQLGEFRDHVLDIEGRGWKEAAADIALTGLGWVAVTGAGTAHVRVRVPQAVSVLVRPPLMPFDIKESTARYTGSRAVRKISKTKSGKWGKGIGRS